MTNNPVVTQAAVVAALIAFFKAVIGVAKAFRWLEMSQEQEIALSYLLETFVAVIAIFVGAWWVSKQVTPLTDAKDVDGTPLTRPDNSPPKAQMEREHKEAIKINTEIENSDERRIER